MGRSPGQPVGRAAPPPHPRPAMGWSSSGRQAVSAQKPPLLPGLPLLSSLPNLVQVVVSEH